MDTKLFEDFSPCVWSFTMMYLYVKKYGKLPDECQRCWKPLAFFDDESCFIKFRHKLKSLKPSFRFKAVTKGIVAYAHSIEERDKISAVFRKISRQNDINCRIFWRRAGRYWQDMFPELFGKDLNKYKPFYKEIFKFRKLADKAKSQEDIEAIEGKIFGINTVKHLEWLTLFRKADF
jgi:hypothetical protein